MARAVRRDAWTQAEDEYLVAEVVKAVREGSTRLKAFLKVGKHIGRTQGAVAFRWNDVLAKEYQEEVKKARQERLDKTDYQSEWNIPRKSLYSDLILTSDIPVKVKAHVENGKIFINIMSENTVSPGSVLMTESHTLKFDLQAVDYDDCE